MQLTNPPSKLVLPFANAGGKTTIPVNSQIGVTGGAASLTDGFPPLTRTPLAAGGVPPSGLDMNGILFQMSNVLRWANAGGGYPYDSTFVNDANVAGYPKGARVLRSDGTGYWLSTTDGNVTDPESTDSAAAGWLADFTTGAALVTMTSSNVTLTASQYGKPIIIISGALTANLNLIFPTIVSEWAVINNTSGAFTITGKTIAGTGVLINAGLILIGDGTNIVQFLATTTAALTSNNPAGNIAATNVQAALNELDVEKALLAGNAAQNFSANVLTSTTDATLSGVRVGRGAGAVVSNTALGSGALGANTTGANNTASGLKALLSNTTGYNNTASGRDALQLNTSGINNTASGLQALLDNTTGANNTACGKDSARGITTGSGNSVFGADVTGLAPNLNNNLILASGGVIRLQHDGVGTTTIQGSIVASGDLSFNSGYGSAAKVYGCRAWVNFNGTGTVAIRASGNVSSITDNGTGDYTVNFTTAMPDANYCAQVSGGDSSSSGFYTAGPFVPLISSFRFRTVAKNIGISDAPNINDIAITCVAIFR
jgi:hypothetical protein